NDDALESAPAAAAGRPGRADRPRAGRASQDREPGADRPGQAARGDHRERHPDFVRAVMTDHPGYSKATAPERRPPRGCLEEGRASRCRSRRARYSRDRTDEFDPRTVPKHVRRVGGFDEAVVSLYVKGLTTGEIRAHLAEI